MKEQVVFITGASSGIGKAIGTYLSACGYKVYGTSRDPGKYSGFSAFTLLQMDVREPATIASALQYLLQTEGRIDVLVNNAGIGIGGAVEETPTEQALNVIDVNFHGPVRMLQAVLPQMRLQRSGFIINITSIAGFMGLPYRGFYSASKGALELLTEAVRMETREFGIRICTLAPGDIATQIAEGRYHVPLRMGSPYAKTYGHSLELMNEHVASGGKPIKVAEKVQHILRQRNPKVHYILGSPLQRFSLFLKKVLPDKVYEKLLLNHYKL